MKKVNCAIICSVRLINVIQAYELSTLTGTQVLLLIASENGHVYTFATPKLQPLITQSQGKEFIQACLNGPDTEDFQDFEEEQPKLARSQQPQQQQRNEQPPQSRPSSATSATLVCLVYRLTFIIKLLM
jgi:hypothetical protein